MNKYLPREMADAVKKVQAAVQPPSKGKIQLYSKEYFAACTLGGIIGMFMAVRMHIYLRDRPISYLKKQLAVQRIPWSHLSIS